MCPSTSFPTQHFDPDNPIQGESKEDRLGYQPVAKVLASSLIEQTSVHGLVVSIEGAWGSGKSSLVNMLASELESIKSSPTQIVRFEPWLVGDRDGMLAELMSDLAAAIESIRESEGEPGLDAKTRKVAKQLRGYASKLSRHGATIAKIAGSFGAPGGEAAEKALSGISQIMAEPVKPLPQLKGELTIGLRELGRRIAVVVDDLDRLEPQEAAEVMRLIRAVADFPNVIYVLCYDPKILAASLENSLSVESGSAFLEKIVQVRFSVPHPEAFDLRRWFLEECERFYVSIIGHQMPDEESGRLQAVCDVEGSLLNTPRQVVRALNSIKLYWPSVLTNVSYPDLVWLQMVKLQNKELYSWIEKYLVSFAALYEGAHINEEERIQSANELMQHAEVASIGSPRSLWTLKDFIPGIKTDQSIDDKNRVFNRENDAEEKGFEKRKGLGSPQHSRYYFALTKPGGALEDSELSKIVSAAADKEDLEGTFLALIGEKRPQGGTKFDVLIDRIRKLDQERLPTTAISSILIGLANSMDSAGRAAGVGAWGVRWSWRSAERLFADLLARVPSDDRATLLHSIFSSGKAIGWMMSQLIRGETFAHGRFGDRATDKSKWMLSEEEFDSAVGLLMDRLHGADRDQIINAPELLSLMFGWQQLGDDEGVRNWVQEQISTDEGFLKLLSGCRGWLQSDKTYYPLNRRDLKHFMDFDEALERLNTIADDPDKEEAQIETARELLAAAKVGKDM